MSLLRKYLLKKFVNDGDNNLEKFYATLTYVKWLLKHLNSTNNDPLLLSITKNLLDDNFNPFDLLPNVNRNIKFKSLVVEGNDISGKETYTTYLVEHFNKLDKLTADGEHIKIERLTFPNYDSVIGKEISRLLRVKNKTNFDMNVLIWLFILDRKNTLLHYIKYYNNKNKFRYNVILIFDRFYLSNYAYYVHQYPDIALNILMNENLVYSSSRLELNDYLIFTRNREEPDLLHDELIKLKSNKDENETIELQKQIATNYRNKELYDIIKNNNPVIRFFEISDVLSKNGSSNFRSPYYTRFINNLAHKLGFNVKE